MRKLHLVCNAHLDPAWLWEIEEGAGEALSTFRIAADFCEQFDGFVFNHNEVILYKWVEEYDPALFERIRKLVAAGKWHIMGGWYLQPDCNMPSGESFVRQMLLGRIYFKEKFGKVPTTAINFDPFGHTRGLVQLLRKAGYDSYIVCRPGQEDCPLPDDEIRWIGYDGSEVVVHRAYKAYLSGRGKAHLKVEDWMRDHPDKSVGLVLWGIGNHGGGPSRIDLENLQQLRERTESYDIVHSTPEAYFADLHASGKKLPVYDKDLNPWAVGCYTSQIVVKQKHRKLENELYSTEKMMSAYALQGYGEYPHKELHEATVDLMVSEFHDMLPGSSVPPVEEATVRLIDHGLEILSRLKARAFFAFTSGERKAAEGEVPIFVYNPHPYPVKGIFECEFQLPSSSRDRFAVPVIRRDGQVVPCQAEKELSNLYIEWRKRVAFYAELEPSRMNRFDCTVEFVEEKPKPALRPENGRITFKTDRLEVGINCSTGFIDAYIADGVPVVKPGAFRPVVVQDDDDSWGSRTQSFPNVIGEFKLLSKAKGTRYSGIRGKAVESVRVIEDGDVRTVVEALFGYNDSYICQRYYLPKHGTEVRVDLTVHWNEKVKMLKLAVPTAFAEPRFVGQVAYGVETLPNNGREAVAQKWVAAVDEKSGMSFSIINDGTHGFSMHDGEVRLTLLRSPGYSSLPGGNRPHTMPKDRFSPRIDQGERKFTFWFNAGAWAERLPQLDREALARNEKPYALAYFPSGEGVKAKPLVTLSDEAVQLTAFKKAERSDDYIVRLYEPTGTERSTVVSIPCLGIERTIRLGRFEVKTLRLDPAARTLTEIGLMEDGRETDV